MKNFKKSIAMLLIFAMMFSLAACGNKEEGKKEEDKGEVVEKADGEELVFGYTCMTMNNPFFQEIEGSIRETVEANGDKLITMDPAMDVSLQINQIEDLITQGIDAIFLNPVDWEGIRPALEMLKDAEIPIINFDTEVKDIDYVTSYVGSDNKNAGRVCGEDLIARFPEGGDIVVLDSPLMNSINDRIDGFLEAIEGKGFNIVAQQDAKGDLETALSLTEDILQANSDVLAIMGGNDPTALGALAGCKAVNAKDVIIYGVDGSPDAKTEIANDGQLVGSGAQSPVQIGVKSTEVAYLILNGEDFEERYPVETFLINAENVEEYGTDGWQ